VQEESKGTIFVKQTDSSLYQLSDGVRFYLYISEPPCGDASLLHSSSSEITEQALKITEGQHWTGAKAIDGDSKSMGITRLKCGRSDIKVE
jgi:Adenosine-deaminase (editase) domain